MFARFLWVAFYSLIGLFLIAFMAINRDAVSVRILPFLDPLAMPLFAALSAMFMLGLMIGLSFAAVQSFSHSRRSNRQARAIAQLEKELAATSTQQPI